jgi:hypothetical protein
MTAKAATALVALAAALLLAGCGGSGGRGTATLWVTRDEGTRVMLVRTVPAGLTVVQALEREAKVETRFGGRYVQSIEGIAGSLSARRDWFWFVDGIEGDRSAAEYRLRPGEVAWWDYRSWATRMSVPVVVGAFPEPFLHGFGGHRRLTAVRYWPNDHATRAIAVRIGRRIGADSVRPSGFPVPAGWSSFRVAPGRTFHAWGGAEGPWHMEIAPADAARLAARPRLARFRYEGLG